MWRRGRGRGDRCLVVGERRGGVKKAWDGIIGFVFFLGVFLLMYVCVCASELVLFHVLPFSSRIFLYLVLFLSCTCMG